ncbi:MAG: alpha/beta hydrolase family protein, partial [Candidatus Neoclostridium sp.]
GKSVKKDGPLALMKKLDKPILFIYSKMDEYSRPEKAQQLYDACRSDKTIVWFEKGVHSHVRINAVEKYDGAIERFLSEKIEK